MAQRCESCGSVLLSLGPCRNCGEGDLDDAPGPGGIAEPAVRVGGRWRLLGAAGGVIALCAGLAVALISDREPEVTDEPAAAATTTTTVVSSQPAPIRPRSVLRFSVEPVPGLEDLVLVAVADNGAVWAAHLAGGPLLELVRSSGQAGYVHHRGGGVRLVGDRLVGMRAHVSLTDRIHHHLEGQILGVLNDGVLVHDWESDTLHEHTFDGRTATAWQPPDAPGHWVHALAGDDLLLAGSSGVYAWNLHTRTARRVTQGEVLAHDDDRVVAITCDDHLACTLAITELHSRRTVRAELPGGVRARSPRDAPVSAAFSPDGTRLAIADTADDPDLFSLVVIDTDTGAVVGAVEYPRTSPVEPTRGVQIAWAPDSRGGLMVTRDVMVAFDRDLRDPTPVDAELPATAAGYLVVAHPVPGVPRAGRSVCVDSGDRTVTVPDLVGLPLPEAIRQARRAGLYIVGDGVAPGDPTGPTAHVRAHSPGADEDVPPGSCIGFRTHR